MSKLILSEFSQKGEDIYNTRIKHELPPDLKGKIVAIEVESGDYFIGDTPLKAGICGQKKHPNKQFYFKRIGYDTVYKSVGVVRRLEENETMQSQKVTIEIPQRVYQHCLDLVDNGIFEDVESALKSATIKGVAGMVPLLQETGTEKRHREADKYRINLEILRSELEAEGGFGKTAEEILEGLRKTRREIWEKEYAPRLGQ